MTKKELEVYAALVLVKTSQISEPFSTDWLKDRPDIQIGKFGIEVTEAIGKREGEQRQLDSNILRCETYENANKYISNLKYPKKYHSETKQLPGSERFSLMSGGGYNDKEFNDLIVNRIHDKSSKFLKYPDCKKFSRRGLYISDQELRPCMQLLDIESIRKATKDSVFDVVFVHQLRRLIVVEKDDELTKEYPFDKINRDEAICEAKRVCGSPDYVICCERAKAYRESKDY
ncbi:MAG TPA: hypothetical protein VJ990_05825 [Clostridia bacterium]|nr:hypothetical protein [Clostridia bacterium]